MKRIYWKSRYFSTSALIIVCAFSLIGLILVESFPRRIRQAYFKEKLESSQLALLAMKHVKDEKMRRGIFIDPVTDPEYSGMIGLMSSPVTAQRADLGAKQTSINPNLAAVVVEMLYEAGVKKGDFIAVGMSGSFPAMNICVYAALKTMELQPIIISSMTSSEWGANDPEFLWIDMEKMLNEKRLFNYRSHTVSLGGLEDRAAGLTEMGKRYLLAAVDRNKLPFIQPDDYKDSVKKRLSIYHEVADKLPIKAYINVGGGTASAGRERHRNFKYGLNLSLPPKIHPDRSVMASFIAIDIPVLNFSNITDIAIHYDLPIKPNTVPVVGQGGIYYRIQYNQYLTIVVFLIIIVSHYFIFRSVWGTQIQSILPGTSVKDRMEPMV